MTRKNTQSVILTSVFTGKTEKQARRILFNAVQLSTGIILTPMIAEEPADGKLTMVTPHFISIVMSFQKRGDKLVFVFDNKDTAGMKQLLDDYGYSHQKMFPPLVTKYQTSFYLIKD